MYLLFPEVLRGLQNSIDPLTQRPHDWWASFGKSEASRHNGSVRVDTLFGEDEDSSPERSQDFPWNPPKEIQHILFELELDMQPCDAF